jgi:prepilin-type N-terminal cleavage/methylation domain-containing protein
LNFINAFSSRISTMLSKTHPYTNKGFTLIETLVSIAIMGIIAAIAAPSFLTWVNNKKIEDVTTNIEGTLKEAQSTAIRKNKTCNVWITTTTASTVENDVARTPDPACLPSGTRQIQGANTNIEIAGTGGGSGTMVTFSAVGTSNVTLNTQAFIIYRTDATIGLKKCLVISAGIGIIKTGTYNGTLPLPSAPTATDITNVINQCSVS